MVLRWLLLLLTVVTQLFVPLRTQLATTNCFTCPDGFTSPPGSTSSSNCFQCGGGYYMPVAESDVDSCVPCGRGTFAIPGTFDQCQSCPLGKTTAADATQASLSSSAACVSYCPLPGQYTTIGGTCLPCARGFYCGSGDVPMVRCPNGQTTPLGVVATSVANCTVSCPAGFGSAVVDGNCQPCPLGTYSADALSDCVACSDGFTNALYGLQVRPIWPPI